MSWLAPVGLGGLLGALARTASAQSAVVAHPSPLALTENAASELALSPPASPTSRVRWHASLGVIRGTTYHPGDRHSPAFVILVAEIHDVSGASAVDVGPPRFAQTVLPLIGTGALPTRTISGAHVQVLIGERSFGPHLADARGSAQIAVEVPPGVRQADVIAVDPRGRTTRVLVPLPVPTFPRGLIVSSARFTVGRPTALVIFAIDNDGRWRTATPALRVHSADAQVGPLHFVGHGQWQATLTPTRTGPVHVRVTDDDETSGRPRVLATGELMAEPAAPQIPAPTATARRALTSRAVGARIGLAPQGTNRHSPLFAVDFFVPLPVGKKQVAIGVDLGTRWGHTQREAGPNTFHTQLTQAQASLLGRARWVGHARWAVDGIIGLGFSLDRTDVDKNGEKEARTTRARPLLSLMIGGACRVGPGEIAVDGGMSDVRFANLENGGAWGLVLRAGVRFYL